jgi:hypothetical protein
MVSQYYLGWPLLLHRRNSASKNLQQEPQQPKCCLYKSPYIVAPIRETGDIIARTPLYARLPSDAPTRIRFFFGSRVTGFSRDPSRWSIGSYIPFLQGSHIQRQYHKRTSLHSKSSTIKGLLYAHDPEKCKKGTLSDQPPNYCMSHPRHFCAVGEKSHSKIWRPLGLTLRRMPYGRGTLRILLQRIL